MDVLKAVNDLKVACRKNNCVWHGKLGAYIGHSCPSPVSDGSDVGQLQFLLLFDERTAVKIAAFETVARRVFNARRTAVNETYLCMLYLYSLRLNDVIRIQSVCLDVLVEVVQMLHGVELVMCSCECVKERMNALRSVPCLERRALMVLQRIEHGNAPIEAFDAALVLATAKKKLQECNLDVC